MKNLLALLVLLASSLMTAQATSLHPDTFAKQAMLLTWNIDERSYLASKEIIGGNIKVNVVTKKLELVIDTRFDCPPNALCAAFIPQIKFEIPLESVKTDSCGVVVYKAYEDKRPVDGKLTRIVVRDNSNSICEMVYVAHTMIKMETAGYNRISGEEIRTTSTFTADLLQ